MPLGRCCVTFGAQLEPEVGSKISSKFFQQHIPSASHPLAGTVRIRLDTCITSMPF